MNNRHKANNGLYALLLSAAFAAAQPLPAYAQETHEFDIERSNPTRAIQDFATQSGVQIIASSEQVAGKRLHQVNGKLSTDEALKALLLGTGLKHHYVGERTVALVAEEGDTAKAQSKNLARNFWDRFRLAQADTSRPATPERSGAGAKESAVMLEEIVVSAQKQGDQRLQDVPVPISVVDTQKLAGNDQLRLRDFYNTIPGLSLAPDIQGVQNIAIRGVSPGRAAIPTVGVTVDDVPFGYSLSAQGMMPDFDPGELARMEVLRGPQGTLYGASSMGGLIRYITVEPSTDRFSARVGGSVSSVEKGDDVGYSVRAAANIPLGTTLAVRASGFTRQDAGFIDNPVLGKQDVNTVDARGGTLSALWQPSDTFSVRLGAFYQNTDADGLPEADVLPGLKDLEQNFLPGTGPYERTLEAYNAVINLKLGSVEVTSTSGYNVNDFADVFDSSAIYGSFAIPRNPGSVGTVMVDDLNIHKFSQELRFAAALGEKLDGLLGFFYVDEQSLIDQNIYAVNASSTRLATIYTVLGYGGAYREKAVFGNLTWHATDRLDIQLGARQARNTVIAFESLQLGPLVSGSQFTPRATIADDVFTFLITPQFRITPDLMIYSRIASGYRPGGANTANVVARGGPGEYEPDQTLNYEIGLKGDFFDRMLTVDASIYHIDWQDVQVQVSAPIGGYKTNGSEAKSQGIELSVGLRPLPGLTINAWVDYNKAELTQRFPVFTNSLSGEPGDRLPFTPEHSGHLSFEQTFSVTSGMDGFAGASWSYVGDRISNFRAAGVVRQDFPSYSQTDLRAGLRAGDWTASLFINNVGDKRGIVSEQHYATYRTTYIQPRTSGFSFSKDF